MHILFDFFPIHIHAVWYKRANWAQTIVSMYSMFTRFDCEINQEKRFAWNLKRHILSNQTEYGKSSNEPGRLILKWFYKQIEYNRYDNIVDTHLVRNKLANNYKCDFWKSHVFYSRELKMYETEFEIPCTPCTVCEPKNTSIFDVKKWYNINLFLTSSPQTKSGSHGHAFNVIYIYKYFVMLLANDRLQIMMMMIMIGA